MGMFQPQNYGRDFNESMIGMGNFINGINKTAADQEQRSTENARAERTLVAQEASSKASAEHQAAQAEKLKHENESAALLQEVTSTYSRIDNGEEPTDDDIRVLAKTRVKLPYLSNSLDDTGRLKEAHSILIQGAERAKAMPQMDKPFRFERGDAPEIDRYLDAWNMVLSPARHKTHVDNDGSITGTKGAEYSTDQIQAGAAFSTEGGASSAAYFSIVDANGAPIYRKDAQGNPIYKTDANGKPLLDSEGQPIPQRKLVPSTLGRSNDANARIDFVPADGLIMKSKLALEQLQAESKLTPEQREKLKKDIETNMYSLMPNGAEKLLEARNKDNKLITVSKDTDVINQAGKVIYSNKGQEKSEYKSRTRQEGTREVFEESQDGGRTWKPVSSGPKFNPKGDDGGKAERAEKLRAKIEINRRLHYAVRDYQAALKTGDPESINESITLIEQLNADATEFGVKPQPLPNRPFSRGEEDSIKEQAIKNLTEKQGTAAKLLGIKPSVPAINLEIKQLKSTVKPGSGFNFVSQKQTQQPGIMDAPPPAKQHAGRTIQDDTTGKKYRSNGSQWLEVR